MAYDDRIPDPLRQLEQHRKADWDVPQTPESILAEQIGCRNQLLRLCVLGSLPVGIVAAIFGAIVLVVDVFDAIQSRTFQVGHALAIAASSLTLLHCAAELWKRASVWAWVLTSLVMTGAIWSMSSQLKSTPPVFYIVPAVLAMVSLGIVRAIRLFEARLRNAPNVVLMLGVILCWWWLAAVLILAWVA